MFDGTMNAPQILLKNWSRSYSEKWNFLQHKILLLLRNQNEDITIVFGLILGNY